MRRGEPRPRRAERCTKAHSPRGPRPEDRGPRVGNRGSQPHAVRGARLTRGGHTAVLPACRRTRGAWRVARASIGADVRVRVRVAAARSARQRAGGGAEARDALSVCRAASPGTGPVSGRSQHWRQPQAQTPGGALAGRCTRSLIVQRQAAARQRRAPGAAPGQCVTRVVTAPERANRPAARAVPRLLVLGVLRTRRPRGREAPLSQPHHLPRRTLRVVAGQPPFRSCQHAVRPPVLPPPAPYTPPPPKWPWPMTHGSTPTGLGPRQPTRPTRIRRHRAQLWLP